MSKPVEVSDLRLDENNRLVAKVLNKEPVGAGQPVFVCSPQLSKPIEQMNRMEVDHELLRIKVQQATAQCEFTAFQVELAKIHEIRARLELKQWELINLHKGPSPEYLTR